SPSQEHVPVSHQDSKVAGAKDGRPTRGAPRAGGSVVDLGPVGKGGMIRRAAGDKHVAIWQQGGRVTIATTVQGARARPQARGGIIKLRSTDLGVMRIVPATCDQHLAPTQHRCGMANPRDEGSTGDTPFASRWVVQFRGSTGAVTPGDHYFAVR